MSDRKYRAKESQKDALKREARERQGGACVLCGEALPDDTKAFNLGHDISRSAPKRGEAKREDTYLVGPDKRLTANAIAVHNAQDKRCNEIQGIRRVHEAKDLAFTKPNYTILRLLVDERTRIQKSRIAWFNRLLAADALDSGDVYDAAEPIYEWYLAREKEMNNRLKKEVKALCLADPILFATMQVPGVGAILAPRILADIDFSIPDHASSLHRFAGYSVKDGKREQPELGKPRPMNKRLKIAMRNTVQSFIYMTSAKSAYAGFYDRARATAAANPAFAGEKAGHLYNHAIGVTAKLFLSHLWEVGRRLQGLPVDGPYVVVHLPGHTYIPPQDFGWPDVEDVLERWRKLGANGNGVERFFTDEGEVDDTSGSGFDEDTDD